MSSDGDGRDAPSTIDTATPSSTTPDATPLLRSSKKVKEHLEGTVVYLTKCANNRTLDETRDCFDPDFVAIVVPPQKLTRDEFIAHLNYVARVKPNVHMHTLGLSTVIDMQKGTARVFADFEISSVYQGVVRPSVGMLKFRFGQDGNWRLLHYEATDGVRCMGAMP